MQPKQKQYECNIKKFNIHTLGREVDEKNKVIASLQSTYDTQNLIKDKDELINNQKTIISSLTIDDNLRDIIAQKNHELEFLAKEIEKGALKPTCRLEKYEAEITGKTSQ